MRVVWAMLATLAVAPAAQADSRNPIDAYRAEASARTAQQLALSGFDVGEGRDARTGTVEIYGTRRQVAALARKGISTTLVEDAAGRSSSERSRLRARRARASAGARAAQAPPYTGSDAGFAVWRRYDAVPEDGREQYEELYARLDTQHANASIVKRMSLGKSVMGRDIWALKVTRDADTTPDDSRPAVLYNAVQHAREWLAGETCRRTLGYVVDQYGGATPEARLVTRLVDTRELWFVCVSNPDGYEYTFTAGNRLWRKNMADNDGDGVRGEIGDGVDPNRNFSTHWGQDNEGSSPQPASETYRGPSPASEPETQAMMRLWDRVDFRFQKNDHTAAELLLYPYGFQQYTPTPDNPIFEALAGSDLLPAIADKTLAFDPTGASGVRQQEIVDSPLDADTSRNRFDPDISSELYITNGDTLDDAYDREDILGFTPEGTRPSTPNVSGFEFQDVEGDVEAEFQRHKAFALDLAESADDPANPNSHLANTVQDFYADPFAVSYGTPQQVEVLAKRSLGEIEMRYSINGGPVRRAATSDVRGGERYGQKPGVYYHRVRGVVTGQKAGDTVRVWFAARGRAGAPASTPVPRSEAFTYSVQSVSGARVLIMAAENYTGPVPAQDPDGPHYLRQYTDALDANGVDYDLYDVDAMGNRAPDALGVLSHYDMLVWYTGDDYVTRKPGQPAGTGTARVALDEQVQVRDFLNEGGKLFFTGKSAGRQYAEAFPFRNIGFPEPDEAAMRNDPTGEWCSAQAPEFDENDPDAGDGCIVHTDDFLQYYLGAYTYVHGGQSADPQTGARYSVGGRAGTAFGGFTWGFDDTGAGNQDDSATFITTSSVLDPARHPLYASSRVLGDWLRPGAAPFQPYTGQWYASAGVDNAAYKRLRRIVDLSGTTAAELSFRVSADLEPAWDFMFVEAREVGTDSWTTLAERDGLTTTATGSSCTSGWHTGANPLHPQLLHYMSPACQPTGTTGTWNAFTGSSGGWQEWNSDLGQFAGKQVELAITVATDWGTLGLGTWIDDVRVTADGAALAETSFETDLGGWEAGPPPAGTVSTASGWARVGGPGFEEGAVVATEDTVYTGFGFEGIAAAGRPEFMRRVLLHLGILRPGAGGTGGPPGGSGGSPPAVRPARPTDGEVRARSRLAVGKITSGRRLVADRKGRVAVRVTCGGARGATCKGRARLHLGTRSSGRALGSRRFSIRAGRAATVRITLRAAVRKSLARRQRVGARLVVTGSDTAKVAFSHTRKVVLVSRAART